VAVHLDAISTAAVPVLAWAAMIGVMIEGCGAERVPANWSGARAVLSAAVYVIMIRCAVRTVIGVATAPSF